MNADNVAILQDEIQENLDDAEEVGNILTEGQGEELDDDLLEEFNALMGEGEELIQERAQTQRLEEEISELPQAPTKVVTKKVEVEDDDAQALRELEAELV